MNLIEKLGLEKCREIVGGAPKWALAWCPTTEPSHPYTDACEGICELCIEIKDLCAAISDHGHNYVVGLDVLRDCDIPPDTIVLER